MFNWRTLIAAAFVFGAFSSGTTYQLKSYSIGGASTNSAASTTYHLQASAGQQTNSTTTGTTDSANNGSIQTEQINVPGAPTLSNASGLYYNQLSCIINTSNDPSDSTYAIAISTDNFTTTNYVQANGTVGASPIWQSYTTWGGASGFQIIGLTPNTTYYVKVSAMQGMFSNTAYGPVATQATASPTVSFSVSPSSYSLGSFLPNTVTTSGNVTLSYSTNGVYGGNIYVAGLHSGFYSATKSYTISAFTGNLNSTAQGIGLQVPSVSQTSGGPLSILSPYNVSGTTVGAEGSGFAQMITSSAAVSGGSATADVAVKSSVTTPPASDYSETFTFVASASF